MATWEFGTRQFKAPKKGKGADRRTLLCRVCKEPLGDKPYVMALRDGEGPINEDKDIARVHVECLPDV